MTDSVDHITSAFIAGEKDVFDRIYDMYSPNLYGYLVQMLKDESEAEEVLQESFIKIWKYSDRYDRQKSRLFTWMLTICRNAAIDRLRKRKKRRDKEIQTKDASVYNIHTNPRPEHMDLGKQLEAIDDKYKEVINLLFFEGLTQKETSDQLGIPLGTVKTRLKIGLRELKKIYSYKQKGMSLVILLSWMTG